MSPKSVGPGGGMGVCLMWYRPQSCGVRGPGGTLSDTPRVNTRYCNGKQIFDFGVKLFEFFVDCLRVVLFVSRDSVELLTGEGGLGAW